MIYDSLKELDTRKLLNKKIVMWGMGVQTGGVISWLRHNGYGENILFIVDNFKYTFCKEYEGIPVLKPHVLSELEKGSFIVILAINYAEDVWKQLSAYGITDIYNLRNLEERLVPYRYDMPWHFINRSKGKRYLCYILAGYEPELWKDTIGRVENYQDEDMDYCLVLSGRQDDILEKIAERNGWSYLYTETNQVCFIQNLVIELHPCAEYILKMDEDIFVGKNFFAEMIRNYHKIEEEGEYRIGFAVPVVPLNCCGYVTYLNLIGRKEEYEQQFGRAYKHRFSAVFNVAETAEFLWDTMETFDSMSSRFLKNEGYDILDCYYNIGCIMFSRERWMMMGRWPELPGESGMGRDEAYICEDNRKKDLVIYEIKSALAGHLAFGHQKKRMMQYYREHAGKFAIDDNGRDKCC